MQKRDDFLYELGDGSRIIGYLMSNNPHLDAMRDRQDERGRHYNISFLPDVLRNLSVHASSNGLVGKGEYLPRKSYEWILGEWAANGLLLPDYKGRPAEQLDLLVHTANDYILSRAHIAKVARREKAA